MRMSLGLQVFDQKSKYCPFDNDGARWGTRIFIPDFMAIHPIVTIPRAIPLARLKRLTQETPERMNTSLVYFSHIVFHVQHMGNASGGKTQCIKKKFLGFLKEKLNMSL